jgi:hypothetical protein
MRQASAIYVKPPFGENWNYVAASQYISWVNESKGIIFSHRHEPKAIQSVEIPATTPSPYVMIPSNPHKLHSTRLVVYHSRSGVYNIGMVDTEDASITEVMKGTRVFTLLVSSWR